MFESPAADAKPVRQEVKKAEISAEPQIQQVASMVSILSGTQEKVSKVSHEANPQQAVAPAIQMEDFEEIILDEEDTAQSIIALNNILYNSQLQLSLSM